MTLYPFSCDGIPHAGADGQGASYHPDGTHGEGGSQLVGLCHRHVPDGGAVHTQHHTVGVEHQVSLPGIRCACLGASGGHLSHSTDDERQPHAKDHHGPGDGDLCESEGSGTDVDELGDTPAQGKGKNARDDELHDSVSD